jgi:hypothetical protein
MGHRQEHNKQKSESSVGGTREKIITHVRSQEVLDPKHQLAASYN